MDASTIMPFALAAAALLAGLAVYDVLARYAAPPSRLASAPSAPQRREGPSRAGGLTKRALDAVSATLERVAPFARAEADACREQLARSGVPLLPETWRSLRVLSAAGCAACAFLAAASLRPAPAPEAAAALGLGAFLGWKLPQVELARREKRRRRAIEASLPDAMELLAIAIAAGSPLEQCFREVAASIDGALSEELLLVDQEVNLLGHARETALENLAERCRSHDVGAFAAQLIQAVNQGSSVAEGLTAQAALARETAQAAVLERIRKMPTKLDIVLSACFLPPTVALVVVPTVVDLLHFLNDTMA
ncbi:type II secretion system F family protein [Arabiibacter massiliensis]|uniref:type II secretion system F family protein n=1 Tax=Arabiibacter massiliensis TaxID=1870985 RepID=UPI0009BC0933|nr:type II secretion system F family protein [Arabiibacter massiliensis]